MRFFSNPNTLKNKTAQKGIAHVKILKEKKTITYIKVNNCFEKILIKNTQKNFFLCVVAM